MLFINLGLTIKFRNIIVIIFLTVICLCGWGYFHYKLSKLEIAVEEYQKKVLIDFEIISKYLLKLPTSEEVDGQLTKTKKEIILMFEKERLELESVRANRTKDQFKSLRVALASTGKEQDED